jgi:hypothetical protein
MIVSVPEDRKDSARINRLSLNAYGAEVNFECDDTDFTEWLRFLVPKARFEPLAWEIKPRRSTTFHVHVDRVREKREREHQVHRNGELVFVSHSLSRVQWFLERCLLREASLGLDSPYSLVHAAAAEKNGAGILFPASSKSGKSTLIAALALSGYSYYSDEVGIVTDDQKLLPYPKAVTLKRGGWHAILDTYPEAPSKIFGPANGNTFRHLMAPLVQPPTDLASAVNIDFIIIPKYREGEQPSLEPVSRSVVLSEFARRAMNWKRLGVDGFKIMTDALKRAECFQLQTNDLRQTVGLVDDLVS